MTAWTFLGMLCVLFLYQQDDANSRKLNVERPEPGVQLLGRKSELAAQQLAGVGQFGFSFDGQWVIASVQNRLLKFESRSMQLRQVVTLPVDRITAWVSGEAGFWVVGSRRIPMDQIEWQFEGKDEDRGIYRQLAQVYSQDNLLLSLNADWEVQTKVAISAQPVTSSIGEVKFPNEYYPTIRVSPAGDYLALVGPQQTRVIETEGLVEIARTDQGNIAFEFLDESTGYFAGDLRKLWRLEEPEAGLTMEGCPKFFQQSLRLRTLGNESGPSVWTNGRRESFLWRDGRAVPLEGSLGAVRLSSNGRWLVSVDYGGKEESQGEKRFVRRWDANNGRLMEQLELRGEDWPMGLQISPDGEQWLFGHAGGVSVVDSSQLRECLEETGQILPMTGRLEFFDRDRKLMLDGESVVDWKQSLWIRPPWIDAPVEWECGANCSEQLLGRTLAEPHGFNLYRRQLNQDQLQVQFRYHLPELAQQLLKLVGQEATRVEWSPYVFKMRSSLDDKEIYLAMVHPQRGLRFAVVDVETRQASRIVDLDSDLVRPVASAISADGRAVSVVADGQISVFSGATGQLSLQREVEMDARPGLSREGRWLVIYERESRRCRLYEVASGEMREQWDDVMCCGFSSGSDRFFVGMADGSVQLWSTDPWKKLQERVTEYGAKVHGALSSDGKILAFRLSDTRLELWHPGTTN